MKKLGLSILFGLICNFPLCPLTTFVIGYIMKCNVIFMVSIVIWIVNIFMAYDCYPKEWEK